MGSSHIVNIEKLKNRVDIVSKTDYKPTNYSPPSKISKVETIQLGYDGVDSEDTIVSGNTIEYDDLDPSIQKLLYDCFILSDDIGSIIDCGDKLIVKTVYEEDPGFIIDKEKKILLDVLDKNGNSIVHKLDMFSDEANDCYLYGGDQDHLINYGSRYLNDEIISSIIKKYYPDSDLSDDDLTLLFAKMSSRGCSYIGIGNVIFDGTKNLSDEEFYNKFGFERYTIVKSNNIDSPADFLKVFNYDYMFLDLFLYYQKNTNNMASLKDIYSGSYIDEDGFIHVDKTVETGMLVIDNARILDRYLDGINFTSKEIEFLKETNSRSNHIFEIKSALETGKTVLIVAEDFTLYNNTDDDQNGKLDDVQYFDFGSHTMLVTGMTDDGDLIVSSWGEEYILRSEAIRYNYDPKTESIDKDTNDVFSVVIIDFEDTDFVPKHMPSGPIPVNTMYDITQSLEDALRKMH